MTVRRNLVMGDSIIIATIEIKYLGVIIDNKITWILHITYVKNEVSRRIGIMLKHEIISREIP